VKTITRVLIANRGEIAIRIAKTLKKMGIISIGIYSDADADAYFLNFMDERIRIGPPPPRESYLQIEKILDAALQTRADAIHPGYGFLSENSDFAMRAVEHGLIFIGPPPQAVKKMGSKLQSREIAISSGVPTIQGSSAIKTVEEAIAFASEIGFPVMVKASAGGGGIGMVKVSSVDLLKNAFEDAVKKAAVFFGDPTVYIEKAIENPRHIEVQVFGDQHGHVIHLGERECTIQRRNQKVIEETPSPFVSESLRKKMTDASISLAKAVGYYSSGTVEFVVDQSGDFYFLEMNTRLQVEHTITEMVTGLDLVEWQIRVAQGEMLPRQEIKHHGHAFQFRLCAEDPSKKFIPSPGVITELELPQIDVRCDMAVTTQSKITPYYDSMFGKLIVHASTRNEAIEKSNLAFSQLKVSGIKTNLELHQKVLAHPLFKAGQFSTAFLKEQLNYQW